MVSGEILRFWQSFIIGLSRRFFEFEKKEFAFCAKLIQFGFRASDTNAGGSIAESRFALAKEYFQGAYHLALRTTAVLLRPASWDQSVAISHMDAGK